VADDGEADEGDEEVHRRPRRGNDRHSLLRAPEVAGPHRHRARPAEGEIGDEGGEDEHERPERVEVRDRVEGEPSLFLGGRVAELPGDVGMAQLVQRQADEHDREEDEKDVERH
jgi:hypothetical protein